MEEFKENYLFPDMEKDSFNWELFEKDILSERLMSAIKCGLMQANIKIDSFDFSDFKKRTIANILNDTVTKCLDLEFRDNAIGTIRNLYERDVLPIDNHLFIFKKHPVSNAETSFSTQMANQEVPVHVITVEYIVDEFYSIKSANIQYRNNGTVSYNKPIFINSPTVMKADEHVNNSVKVAKPILKIAQREAE